MVEGGGVAGSVSKTQLLGFYVANIMEELYTASLNAPMSFLLT